MSLGSGILKKPIPDPGSRVQIGTGSRIRNTVTKLCLNLLASIYVKSCKTLAKGTLKNVVIR
jgi:hypothetical protein